MRVIAMFFPEGLCPLDWNRQLCELGILSGAVLVAVINGRAEIYCTQGALAAIKAGGSVVAWGNAKRGGRIRAVKDKTASNVERIYPSKVAFAAKKADGSVIAWGDAPAVEVTQPMWRRKSRPTLANYVLRMPPLQQLNHPAV